MRAFAFALLLALALLPKTGWVVRNETDVLRGRWGPGVSWDDGTVDSSMPTWPYERKNLADPVARSLMAREGADFEEKWRERQAALDDPRLRPILRGPLLRRSFSAAVVSLDHPSSEQQRAIARRLLPFAEEGERADPGNAFYPSSAFSLDVLLDRPEAARAALTRAARCSRYDDASFAEVDLFMDGFERQYGYRGSLVRLLEGASILLPHLTALRHAAEKTDRDLPLDAPERQDLMRLGETMVRTSPTIMEILVGRSVFYEAMGLPRTGKPHPAAQIATAVDAFRAANPGWADDGALALMAKDFNPGSFATGDPPRPVLWAPVVGAGLLLALLGGFAAAWPARREPDEAILARLRRASWAWLAGLPIAALMDNGASLIAILVCAVFGLTIMVLAFCQRARPAVTVGIAACVLGLLLAPWGWFVPPALWAAAVAMPARWRPAAWVVSIVPAAVAAAYHVAARPTDWSWTVGFALALMGLRVLFPLRREAAWVPAVLAALYLVGVVGELRADAQIAEIMRQWGTEASRFREARGI